MKRSNHSAFTLIELLAVILILSVITLIAVPVVSNVVAESKKSSFGVTCQQVYKALEKYASFQQESTCVVFDFSKNVTESEMIDGVNYQPVSKLQLNGKLPSTGQAKMCDGTLEVKAGNEDLTCLVTKEVSNVLARPLDKVDLTDPILEGITLTSTTSTIKVVVNANDEDGRITKYYYSLDDEKYTKTTSPTHTFTNLKANTEYTVYVRVENESGLVSHKIKKKIKTKVLETPKYNPPVKDEDEREFEYFDEYVLEVVFPSENITNPEYYFKTTASATVKEGVVVAICGKDTVPKDCVEGTVTELEPNVWYKTELPSIQVTYKEDGTLYTYVTDGVNQLPPSTFVVSGIDTTGPSCKLVINDEDIKTSEVTIKADCYDLESGIVKYEFSNDGGVTWVNNGNTETYTFTKLVSSTNYTFKIRGYNGAGMPAEDTKSASPIGFKNPTISDSNRVSNEKDENGDYKYAFATSKTVKITYNDSKIASPEYYFKTSVSASVSTGVVAAACGKEINPGKCTSSNVTVLVADTWYRTDKMTPEIIYASAGRLYALMSDGTNISGTATHIINDIDVSEPTVSLTITAEKTSSTSLKATCEDKQSNIIKYEFSKDDGDSWVENGTKNTHTFTGLKQGTTYKYKVRCTNGTGILNNVASAESMPPEITNPTINEISTVPSDKNTYKHYTSITVGATYNTTNIENPVFYFKTSVNTTVPSGTVINSCTDFNNCNGTPTTNVVANTWYKVYETIPVTFTTNGTFYAATGDGANISATSTYVVSDIDSTPPEANLVISIKKSDRTSVTATCSDSQSDIIKYEFSLNGNDWTSNGKTNTYTFTGLNSNTSYTYHVRCTNGAGNTKTASVEDGPDTLSIGINSQVISSGYTYYQSRTAMITYPSSSNTSYYFKTSVNATTTSGTVRAACGTGTEPANCANSATTSLTANVWYRTDSVMPLITYTTNGSLSAIADNGVTKYQDSFSVTNINTTKPTVTLTGIEGYVAKLSLSDDIGLKGYKVSTTTSVPTSGWTNISGTSNSVTWTPSTYGAYGDYYMHVEDVAGNSSYVKFTISAASYEYDARLFCTGDRILENGECFKEYKNDDSKCGCKEYNACEAPICSCIEYKSREDELICGCSIYNSREDGNYCGYNACTYAAEEYCTNGNLNIVTHQCKTAVSLGEPKPLSSGGTPSCEYYLSSGSYYSNGLCFVDNYSNSDYRCPSGGNRIGLTCSIDASNTNNGCSPKTCAREEFGCQTANSCPNPAFGCKEYDECPNDTCTCKVANSCKLAENSYKAYDCPNGGKLSGTKCKFGI